MKRFFSHFVFIYPDIFLKNNIVELDSVGYITNCFVFEKEIANTKFYSGVLYFIPVEELRTFDFCFNQTSPTEFVEKLVDTKRIKNTKVAVFDESRTRIC